MSSNALVGPSGGSNFAQQGAVDWVALSKSSLSFSIEVLSRFSKAGVELITVAIGQAIFSSFDVPADGQKRLSDAVAKLKAFASYGDVLWFGFGVKHITRILCETEQGATCVAICACLSVSYDTNFASQVLKASTDLTKAPGSLTPALSQWGALMNVCAGAVADSQFPVLVEGFSRLIGGTSQGCNAQPLHAPTTAQALAGAIQELSKVSNRTLRNVTFQGGVDCGWLAAVAQWLLSLRVEIIDATGSCLYSNFSQNDAHPQVIIIQQLSAVGNPEGTITRGRSYFVSPGSLHFGLSDPNAFKDAQSIQLYSYGRSDWNIVLRQTFGGAIDELLQPKYAEHFAAFLCLGFDEAHKISKMEDLNPWGASYLRGCHERRGAFMSFTSTQLPELDAVVTIAESHGYDFTSTSFNQALSHICTCKKCRSELQPTKKNLFCLHRVGATIFKYLWVLSWLDIESSVRPSPSGLLMMYHTRTYGDEDPELLRSQFWQFGLSTALFPLFTGTTCDERTTEGVSAISHNGICIYYKALEDPDVNPSRILRLRVVLGQIERGGSLYRKIRDGNLALNEAKVHSPFPSSAWSIGPRTRLMLVVDETLDSRSIEASFYIDTKPLATESIFVTSQSYAAHAADTADATKVGSSLCQKMFGVCELRNNIMKRITIKHCRQQIVQRTLSMSDNTTSVWTGKCSEIASNVCQVTNKELFHLLPKEGEWVISDYISTKPASASAHRALLCGKYTVLYSNLCYTEAKSCAELLCISPCFTCSARSFKSHPFTTFENTTEPLEYFRGAISIYSMKEPIPCIFDLAGRVENVPATDLARVSKSPSPPTVDHPTTKREIEAILTQRGIKFKRSSKKQALLRLLQEHERNSIAAGENGQGSAHEERSDVEMSDDI